MVYLVGGDIEGHIWLACLPSEHIGVAGLELGAGPVSMELSALQGGCPDGGFRSLGLRVTEPADPGGFYRLQG